MVRKKADPAYLFIPKDKPINDLRSDIFLGVGLSDERQQEIMDQLADKGVHTYGQYVRFCMTLLDNEIPGLEPRAMLAMCQFVLHSEHVSKEWLVEQHLQAQEEIARLKKQQPVQQLAETSTATKEKGREIAQSM